MTAQRGLAHHAVLTAGLWHAHTQGKGYKTVEEERGVALGERMRRQSPITALYHSQPPAHRILGVPCQSSPFLPRQFVSS